MHINHLYLKNYYQLENFKCDFKQPISVFIGENGAGKSTVIAAIVEKTDILTTLDRFRKTMHFRLPKTTLS